MNKYSIPAAWCIVIPAYNAGNQITLLIERLFLQYRFYPEQLVVVDDGSTDDSIATLRHVPLTLLSHPINLGKGKAMMTGWKYAGTKNFQWILFMDADGQHTPEVVAQFIHQAHRHPSDLIIGRRKIDRFMPWTRKTSNFIGTLIVSLLLNQRIYDTQSGFRLVRLLFLEKFSYTSSHYDLETEILFKFIKSAARISYVEIPTIYHAQSSHYRLIPDLYRFFKILLHLIF